MIISTLVISVEREFVPDPRLRVLEAVCSLVGKNRFGHVSGGRLDIVGATVDAIIFYRKSPPSQAVLHFQSDISGDWVLVEKDEIWEDVPLFDEEGPEFLSPGESVLCLLVGRANNYDDVVDFALVLRLIGTSDSSYYQRIGLLVSKVGQNSAF